MSVTIEGVKFTEEEAREAVAWVDGGGLGRRPDEWDHVDPCAYDELRRLMHENAELTARALAAFFAAAAPWLFGGGEG